MQENTMIDRLKRWIGANPDSQRAHDRRTDDICICNINGRDYPVKNWSFGGMYLDTDGRLFCTQQNVYFTLKFRIGHRILNISHRAVIVRKNEYGLALQFDAPDQDILAGFEEVLQNSHG